MNSEIEKVRVEEMPEDYYPPKDLANAIWGACFDYKDIDKSYKGKTIRDRVKEACFNAEKLRKLEELSKK